MNDESRQPISAQSLGPTPDSLELKVSGAATLHTDLRRTQEVEIVVRGVVTGHTFSDKYGKTGDVEHTVKVNTVRVDELVELTVLSVPRHMKGQTAMAVEDPPEPERAEDGAEIVDAEIAGELPAGEPPPGVDPETGEIIAPDITVVDDEAEADEDAAREITARDRVRPEAWNALTPEQQRDVVQIIDGIDALSAQAANEEDEVESERADAEVRQALEHLRDTFHVDLLDEDEARRIKTPTPPRVEQGGAYSIAQLRERRAYLMRQTALPAEAQTARTEELRLIDAALGKAGAGEEAA